MNKSSVIKKVAICGSISITQAARKVSDFEFAIEIKDKEIKNPSIRNSSIFDGTSWRQGSRKKGGKTKYIRK
jgi:hypothetical protein